MHKKLKRKLCLLVFFAVILSNLSYTPKTIGSEKQQKSYKPILRIEINKDKSVKVFEDFITEEKTTQSSVLKEIVQTNKRTQQKIKKNQELESTFASPNLIIYTGTDSYNAYSYNSSSHVLNVSNSIGNTGDTDANDFCVGWYLSTDVIISINDYNVTYQAWFNLPYGYFMIVNSSVDLDDVVNLPAGTYYLGVYVDDLNQVNELNENDNIGYFNTPIYYPGIIIQPGPWVNKGLSDYQFDSVFEDSTTVRMTHGVAVDWNNRIWSGSYGSEATGIIVRNPDGIEASFSPLTSVTVSGTAIDLSYGGCRGMGVAKDGNILYVMGSQLIKINYMTGEGIALWEEPDGKSLTNPGIDNQGFIYIGRVAGVNPVYVINGATFETEKIITLPNAPEYSRGVAVSLDGTTLWTGDLGIVGCHGGPIYKWTSNDFVNYSITDSIFANSNGERIFTTTKSDNKLRTIS